MTEKELRKQLQNVYGDVPPATHAAFQRALSSPEQTRGETTVKKRIAAVPVLVVLLVLLAGGAAYAAVSQVMDWYYTNWFDMKELDPEQYETMMSHVLTDIPQSSTEDDLVRVRVPEAILVPADAQSASTFTGREEEGEKWMRSVSVLAAPVDGDAVELHPYWNLDPDGSYLGGDYDPDADYGEDSEERPDHWLLTEKGFGPVTEMMEDPSKQLVLIDVKANYSMAALDVGMDNLGVEDGSVLTVLEDTLDEPYMDAYRVEGGWEMPMNVYYSLYTYDPETDSVSYHSSGTVTLTLYVQE